MQVSKKLSRLKRNCLPSGHRVGGGWKGEWFASKGGDIGSAQTHSDDPLQQEDNREEELGIQSFIDRLRADPVVPKQKEKRPDVVDTVWSRFQTKKTYMWCREEI
jgi:hypothetical protein